MHSSGPIRAGIRVLTAGDEQADADGEGDELEGDGHRVLKGALKPA